MPGFFKKKGRQSDSDSDEPESTHGEMTPDATMKDSQKRSSQDLMSTGSSIGAVTKSSIGNQASDITDLTVVSIMETKLKMNKSGTTLGSGDEDGEGIRERTDEKIMYRERGRKLFGGRLMTRKEAEKAKQNELENAKNELVQCCLTHMLDSYRVHLNRLKGIKILNSVMDRIPVEDISETMAIHMTWSCVSCIHHFILRLKTSTGPMRWIRIRDTNKAFKTYERMIHYFMPNVYSTMMQAIIAFCEEGNLWELDYLCSNILKRLLLYAPDFTKTMDAILTLIENSTLTNPLTARQILQVMYEIEKSLKWSLMDEELLRRFLNMHYSSITPEHEYPYNYECLEKGLEVCLRSLATALTDSQLLCMIEEMLKMAVKEEISDTNLLNFGNLLEDICGIYHTTAIHRSMPDQVFPLLLKLLASENLLYSLMGNRVLHQLIDRASNRLQFDTPRIFFEDAHYSIHQKQYNSEDKEFFRRYREQLHSIMVTSIIKHGIHKVHLENTYMSIALFLVEIPCAYTAAAGVCLAMGIQEAALEEASIEMIHAHRLHATVGAIMSLVCYLHRAGVFYDYVNTIIDRRAQWAPQLNPPLKTAYKYAQHHILWNKPELFFEDWEARYGLWKCFKSKKINLGLNRNHYNN